METEIYPGGLCVWINVFMSIKVFVELSSRMGVGNSWGPWEPDPRSSSLDFHQPRAAC